MRLFSRRARLKPQLRLGLPGRSRNLLSTIFSHCHQDSHPNETTICRPRDFRMKAQSEKYNILSRGAGCVIWERELSTEREVRPR